ncbi:MAG: hypothetical protein QOD39_4294 [Mycobacterium sp.]|nr:hypothetical protein [Mycobacterium sp.]
MTHQALWPERIATPIGAYGRCSLSNSSKYPSATYGASGFVAPAIAAIRQSPRLWISVIGRKVA